MGLDGRGRKEGREQKAVSPVPFSRLFAEAPEERKMDGPEVFGLETRYPLRLVSWSSDYNGLMLRKETYERWVPWDLPIGHGVEEQLKARLPEPKKTVPVVRCVSCGAPPTGQDRCEWCGTRRP